MSDHFLHAAARVLAQRVQMPPLTYCPDCSALTPTAHICEACFSDVDPDDPRCPDCHERVAVKAVCDRCGAPRSVLVGEPAASAAMRGLLGHTFPKLWEDHRLRPFTEPFFR